MRDPFGSMQNMMGQFRQFMSNPQQYLSQRMGIPMEYCQNPNTAIQYLMNQGKISQQDYNSLNDIAGKIKNRPDFRI